MNMERGKNVLLALLLTFGILFAINLVSAETLINNPASSAIIGGNTVTLNATNGTSFFANLTNCSFYALSASTGNNTQTLIAVANASSTGINGQNDSINVTFSSRILEDANDYTFAAVCWARTNAGVHYQLPDQTNSTSVRIDNSVPLTATSISPANGNQTRGNNSIVITSSVQGNVTTSCTIQFTGTNPNQTSIPMTHTGNTCTAQLQGIPSQSYEYFIRTSDGTNTSDSGVNIFSIIPQKGSSSVIVAAATTPSADGKGNVLGFSVAGVNDQEKGDYTWVWVLAVIAVIVVVVVLIARRR